MNEIFNTSFLADEILRYTDNGSMFQDFFQNREGSILQDNLFEQYYRTTPKTRDKRLKLRKQKSR